MTFSTSAVAVCWAREFAEIARFRLHLLEQPDILDGDDRLIGEGLKQLDMMVGKSAGLSARHRNGADRQPSLIIGANMMLRKPRARAIPRISFDKVSVSAISVASPVCAI